MGLFIILANRSYPHCRKSTALSYLFAHGAKDARCYHSLILHFSGKHFLLFLSDPCFGVEA